MSCTLLSSYCLRAYTLMWRRRHAVAFAARGPELGMTAGDWCRPVCKGFGRLRLSVQSMAIYPSGAAAK